ncbi:hypothetical protein [Haloprofundus salinisoli]|uniref:hypothetical protein n=1 Tax=Haloprofundus salinisoli TaxID=2876193 RepID=UPI001CCDE3B4|nr:hypothetical protein [Haloprofundus salinisoli]
MSQRVRSIVFGNNESLTHRAAVASVVFALGVASYGFVDPTALYGLTLFSAPALLGVTVGIGGLTLYAVRGGGVGGAWTAVFAVLFALSLHGQHLFSVSLGVADGSAATAVARAIGYAGSLAAVVGSLVFVAGVAVRRRESSVSRGDVTPLSFLLDVRRGRARSDYDWAVGALAVVGTASLVVAGSLLPWSTAIYTVGIGTLLGVALYARRRNWERDVRLGVLSLAAVLLAAHLSQFTHPALLNGVVVVLTVAMVAYGSAHGEHVFACLAVAVGVSSLLGVVWAVQSIASSLGGVLAVSVGIGLGPGIVVGAVGYALGWAVRPDESERARQANQRVEASNRTRHRVFGDD